MFPIVVSILELPSLKELVILLVHKSSVTMIKKIYYLEPSNKRFESDLFSLG